MADRDRARPAAPERPGEPPEAVGSPRFLQAPGAMAASIRAYPWAGTPLGDPASWCQPLQTLTELMLASQQPMFVAWGPEQTWLYNDAFVPILGRKHPSALGRPALEVWREAREELTPLFDRVFAGESVHMSDIALMLDRRGRLEEAHFNFSYTPARDGSGAVAGLFGACVETTEQVLSERRQAADQERQRRLFEQAPGFIAITHGPDHRFEFVNEAYERLAGGRPLLGRPVCEAFPELEDQGFFELLDHVFASGQRYAASQVPVRLRSPAEAAASERYLDFVYAPVVDAAGTTTGIFVEGHDVTEAFLAQQELEDNERRQAMLIELGDRFRDLDDPADLSFAAAELLGGALGVDRVGYGTVDPVAETIVIERDWNAPGIESLAGVLHFRDYGTYIEDLKKGETVVFADAEKDPRTRDTADALRAISAQAVVNMPVTEQHGLVALLYLNHGSPREWSAKELAFVREVAERTRSAVERRRAEKDLRSLAESLEQQVAERTAERDRVWRNSRDLLVVIGTDGIFRAVNPAWTAILGHDPGEVVGRSFLDFVWPEDAVLSESGLRTAARRNLTDFENRYRHRDGTPRWISWHTAAEGGLVYAYGRDITAQKAQARALLQAEEALRQSQKLEAIGQLTGGVAHDFNNLLAVVSNNLFLHLRLSPACESSPQLDAIARATETGARLTRQLLAFARRQAIRPEVLVLQEELPDLRHVLQATVGSAVEIRFALDPETPPVEVDRSELELAIINLAMNARDAMPGGGVLEIRCRREREGGDAAVARIEVEDTGHGIPPEILPRVTEPFFSTKGPGRGTGLGLSQVYGFVTQASGRLEISSRSGEATTVALLLPATDRSTDETASAAPGPRELLDARVLIVEDNLDVGSTTRELLQVAGCEVLHLTSGDQALAFLRSRETAPVDLVLSDVVMPGEVSGVALARWITEQRPALPVLLATGYSSELTTVREQGFTVLQKPVAPEALIEAIRSLLAGPERQGERDPAPAGRAREPGFKSDPEGVKR
jgi:PAS domain S-box-containing protein